MNSKRKSVFQGLLHRPISNKLIKLSDDAKDDESFVQRLGLVKNLPVHSGCVNTICWNEKGNYILSGSDDQHLVITNGFNYKVEEDYNTSHRANIFSAKFMPCSNDRHIVSCSGDGMIIHTDLNRPKESYNNQFDCHSGTTTYEVITVPYDPNTFLSCSEDGTVRWFDLRAKTSCRKACCKEDILISCQRAVTALAINPTASHQLAIGCADSTVRIYDRRFLSTQPNESINAKPFCSFVAPHFDEDRHYRITSLSYSAEGQDMLVSYSSDYLYLFNVQENKTTALKKNKSFEKAVKNKKERFSPPPVRRLRLRGDWSDTGPDARPERDVSASPGIGQARPQLQATLMQRMTDVLSRMLNDPMTRAALSAGGEDSVDPVEAAQRNDLDQPESGEAEELSNSESRDEQEQSDLEQDLEEQPVSRNEVNSESQRQADRAVTSDLHNHLSTLRSLREGFIEQHGSEPSVSFRYSDQSTSTSTISLKVGDDVVQNNESLPSSEDNEEHSENVDVELDFEEVEETPEEELEERVYEAEMRMKYMGHRNARTMIKEATFWGKDYVMSGSDCGHIFIWNRHTAKLKMLLQGDQHVVNCLQPHPTLPILATSGIDHDIKLWAPILTESPFDQKMADDLINRNAIMLEETRDTITVPAAFMIRMLACLNQIRRGIRPRSRRREDDEG